MTLRNIAPMLFMAFISGAALAGALMVHHYAGGVWVSCDVAEISPDVPPQLKEWCRKQRSNHVRP